MLALLAGLQIVSWILDLLNGIASVGADSDYLAASFFFVLVVWGFVTSGDKLTGRKANTIAYPRDGRILLTVAYTLVSNASLLYLGALRVPRSSAHALSYLTADPVTPVGLAALGSALVIVAFVAGMNRRSGGPAGRAALAGRGLAGAGLPGAGLAGAGLAGAGLAGRAALAGAGPGRIRAPQAPARSLSAAQVAVAGIGAVAIGAALVILSSALPRLAQANAVILRTTYVASVPGPGCDAGRHRRGHDVLSGGALWSVTPGEPITTKCGPAGLHVEIAPGRGGEGDVKFLPPDGFASHGLPHLGQDNAQPGL